MNPAVSGTPIKASPASTKPAKVIGICLPTPCIDDIVALEPMPNANMPTAINKAPFIKA